MEDKKFLTRCKDCKSKKLVYHVKKSGDGKDYHFLCIHCGNMWSSNLKLETFLYQVASIVIQCLLAWTIFIVVYATFYFFF